MSEDATTHVTESAPAHEDPMTSRLEGDTEGQATPAATTGPNGGPTLIPKEDAATDAPVESQVYKESANRKQSASDIVTAAENSHTKEDTEMMDPSQPEETVTAGQEFAQLALDTPISANKPKTRRKSTGVPEHKGKKLNRKASKAKMTQIDAKPGDYFYVRLKGYPLWPAIVCDESMLPTTLLKSRPVTAARADGTYRNDYMDGAPKAKDRSFPVMYLHTNEFGWIPNYDLVEIDFDDVGNVTSSMRKDLQFARRLAAERHDLDYFKAILKNFMEAREADRIENERIKEVKRLEMVNNQKDNEEKKKTPKKPKKLKSTAVENADLDMPDAGAGLDSEEAEASSLSISGKRPAEEPLEGPPPKKQTIKITTSKSISANGTPKSTPKSTTKKSTTKTADKSDKPPKAKKAKVPVTPEIAVLPDPELTQEGRRLQKEKEILFLRHKLQRGLLAKDQEPKEEEMPQMSEFLSKLAGYANLEVSIIRQTKINKVLKAILKVPNIPKEEEYMFKPRSQTLLDKWNKLLASDSGPTAAVTTNGPNTEIKSETIDGKDSSVANGSLESTNEKKEHKKSTLEGASLEPKEGSVDEPSKKSIAEPRPVEDAA